MLVEQDTLEVQHQEQAITVSADSVQHKPSRPQTPYQVLRMLPRDATPAQQDSAIQAWFKPGEIHYSDKPDTLHLPGHGIGRNLKDVNLPQYYRESFFSKDSLLHPEISGGQFGIAGDPIPYQVRNDNIFTSILLLCFITAIISFTKTRSFVVRQLKSLVYTSHHDDGVFYETGSELWFQLFLLLMSAILMAISIYFYVTNFVAKTFILDNEYVLIGIFALAVLTYFLLKGIVYSLVNNVFFGGKKNRHFLSTLLFVTSVEGVAIYPIVLLQVFFEFPVHTAIYSIVFVLIICKMVTFYKSWTIFFRQNAVFLQIFLYFCALEIVPMLTLWGALVQIVNQVKVNY